MKALALVAITSTGCLVVTRTTTTTTKVGIEQGEAVPAKLDQVMLAASANEHSLVVHAVLSGTCSRDVSNVFEVRESKHLAMGGADDPRAKVLGLILSPVTIPVSALVSGLSLLGGDDLTRVTKLDHKELAPCTRPADHVALAIELASGAKATARANEHGDLVYTIPPSEPYDGTIKVRSGAASRDVVYHQQKPAYVAARDALETCGAGAATLALQVNDHGGAQLAWVAGAEPGVVDCVRSHLATVVFPVRSETVELPFGLEHIVDTAHRLTPVCARVDGDELGQRTLARVLEQEDLLVSADTCEETYTGWIERSHSGYMVHVRNAAGARHTLVPTEADIPGANRQLVRTLIEKETEAQVRPAVDAEPIAAAVEQHDEAPTPAESVSTKRKLFYGRFGIGSVTSFGVGYRVLWGQLGYDISASFGASNEVTTGAVKNEFIYAPSAWYVGTGFSLGATQSNGTMVGRGSGYGFELTAGRDFMIGSVRALLQADVTVPLYSIDDATYSMPRAPTTGVVSIGIGGS